MLIELPEAIAQSSMSMSAKLITATYLSYPGLTPSALGKLLGCSSRNVHKALKLARSHSEQLFAQREQKFAHREQSFPPLDKEKKEEKKQDKPKPKPAGIVPDREEFFRFARLLEEEELAAEFWDRFEDSGWTTHSGKPIGNWKSYLQACMTKFREQQKPAPRTSKNKPKVQTTEDALMAIDMAGNY